LSLKTVNNKGNKMIMIRNIIVSAISILITTTTNAAIVGSFGNNLPMETAIESMVPQEWQIRTTEDVLRMKVSWNNKLGWKNSMREIAVASKLKLSFIADDKIIVIKKLTPKKMSIIKAPIFTKNKKTLKIPYVDVLTPIKTPAKIALNPIKTTSPATTPKSQVIKTVRISKDKVIVKGNKKAQHSISTVFSGLGKIFEKKYKATKLDKKVESLLSDLRIPATNVRSKKIVKTRDNTVRINISFMINNEEVQTYLIFNGVSVYSPYISKEMSMAVLDWYSSNFIHPSPRILSPIQPISESYRGEYVKKIATPVNPRIRFKMIPEYLRKKDMLVSKDKMISDIISGWGDEIGVKVIWKASSDFKIKREILMFGGFLQSVDELIKFYNNTKTPLQTRFFIKNKTLLVMDLQVVYRYRHPKGN